MTLPQTGTADAYSNPSARLGYGTGNLVQTGGYIPERISLDYMLLLALYRSSWIVRAVVDVVAEDALKSFPTLDSEITPEEVDEFNRAVLDTASEAKVLEAYKWGRLFGGAIGIMCFEGMGKEELAEPLDEEQILPFSYRGILALDRWSGVTPGSELIADLSNPAEFGLPAYYDCTTETGASFRVHHTRCLRFAGRDLPLFEKQIQSYWGMSEVEAVFEELKKRDYASNSIASLLSRANIMVIKEPMLAQGLSGLNLTNQQYTDYIARLQAVSDGMNNQGLLALGDQGELQSHQYSFGGLSEVYQTFMLDVAGACQIPVSRLYGRTITGLGQSGEGDLQIYYDMIAQKQKRELRPQLRKLFRVIAKSTWGNVPDDLNFTFPPTRTMSDEERADLADKTTKSVIEAYNVRIISQRTAMKELQQYSAVTGLFSNITDEDVAKADDSLEAMGELNMETGMKAQEMETTTGDAA